MKKGKMAMDQELFEKLAPYDKMLQSIGTIINWPRQQHNDFIRLVKEEGKDWETISRKLGELGFEKDAKQCREKGYRLA